MSDTKLAEALQQLQPIATTILKARPMDFEDASYHGFPELLDKPMRDVLMAYEGTNSFLRELRVRKDWSPKQSRAVANILRRELRGEAPRWGRAGGQAATPTDTREYPCFTCKEIIVGKDALYEHKRTMHGAKFQPPSGDPVVAGTIKPVLPDFKPIHNIDLRLFPAARFAVEDPTGTLRFFIITELKRRTRFTGRFVWTKFNYANEYLDKGDRTVRELRGDTKKFIGKQRVKDPVYFGEEEDLLKAISENPIEAMLRFGREKGACSYCGRTLTDDDSRKLGIGPDCYASKHEPMLRLKLEAMIAAGKP